MKELLAKNEKVPALPKVGDLVEGKIIKISKNAVVLDLESLGAGIIYGAELRENKEMLKKLKVGEKISALVLDTENEDGYIELSLKEATLEKNWSELKEKKQNNQPIVVKAIDANRGGLVVNFSGVIGFLPVSQLSSQNYPRVEGGDKNKILRELNKFIGKEFTVKIISLDKKTNKLVVSEKALKEKEVEESLKHLKKGDIIEGTVAGLADFGAFVKFADNLEGLIHISELDWQMVNHPSQILQENQPIKAQIIDIQHGQISLSLKTLKEDPWQDIEKKYKSGQVVKGEVIKLSPAGAFVQIEKGVNGLVHLSNFLKQNQTMEDVLKIGQSYKFEILSLAPNEHKMSLALQK